MDSLDQRLDDEDPELIAWLDTGSQAIASGMCKVNVGTDLRIASTAGIRELIRDKPDIIDMRKILGPARSEMKRVIVKKMNLLGSSGKG